MNIPTHKHTSDEYLYFINGAGAVSIDGKLYQVKNGTTVFIPRGVEHSYINNSRKTAKTVQVYTPAGPEQRFKKLKKH